MQTPPSRAHVAATLRRTHEVGAEFLIADLELALTLLDRAELSQDPCAYTRNLDNARHALRTVDGFFARLDLDENHRTKVLTLRGELERRIEALSE
jgi:hypothetical protein